MEEEYHKLLSMVIFIVMNLLVFNLEGIAHQSRRQCCGPHFGTQGIFDSPAVRLSL